MKNIRLYMNEPMNNRTGKKIDIKEYGGQGGIEIVTIKGHAYARKHILPDLVEDEDSFNRFIREIKIAQKINSSNVIKVVEYNPDRNDPNYTMPWYKSNLGKYIQDNHEDLFSDPTQQKTIFLSILQGVDDLHRNGIIHRDLKPSNILINDLNDMVICDFGISKDANSSKSLTYTGEGFGTEGYSAPEQWKDSKHVDCRSDIYSLGMILNDLSGRSENHSPKHMQKIADKASAYNKEERYKDVSELIKDVTQGYDIWIRSNNGVTASEYLKIISEGKISEIELIFYVNQILGEEHYLQGNSNELENALSEDQYIILEQKDIDSCIKMFNHIWDEWWNNWNNDYEKIDVMTRMVEDYWSLSESPIIKGFNLARLTQLAHEGHRYRAMKSMADMITELGGDEETQEVLLENVSASIIKDNFKVIKRTPPSWL